MLECLFTLLRTFIQYPVWMLFSQRTLISQKVIQIRNKKKKHDIIVFYSSIFIDTDNLVLKLCKYTLDYNTSEAEQGETLAWCVLVSPMEFPLTEMRFCTQISSSVIQQSCNTRLSDLNTECLIFERYCVLYFIVCLQKHG